MGLIFFLSAQADLKTSLGLGGPDRAQGDPRRRVRAVVVPVAARPALRAPGWAAVIVLAYAATDELHQHFVHGRIASPLDWAIDALGVAAAVLVVEAARSSRARWRRARPCARSTAPSFP